MEEPMASRNRLIGALAPAFALVGALAVTATAVTAHDESKYPDWSGQWHRPKGVGINWDQDKRTGLAQQAPLKPEYQKVLEASLEDQRNGGQGIDNRFTCMTNGMPRMMAVIGPIEWVILPQITYVHFEAFMPRRIYTDGRAFPTNEEPSFAGYSVGQWSDTDGDGRFDMLDVETRNFKGPRTVESTGIPLAEDNLTVVKEKIYLDKSNPDMMHNIVTIIDNAFTQPWTVDKRYIRQRDNITWFEDNCNENNHHVVIGKDNYYLNANDGMLMPARKGQRPPNLKYFNASQN
jgi:hypothetical protein